MNKSFNSKSYCIYGLGVSGKSVVNFFNKNHIKTFSTWDNKTKNFLKNNLKKKILEKEKFSQNLYKADYIVMSPGINFEKTEFSKELMINKNKIITDLDLFYIFNPKIKTVVVTGTNGKSTACKMLEHILRKKNLEVKLGGNIGLPILDIKLKKNPIVIIEASSFQLFYSKFVKPKYAAILNITNDHLDWHGNYKSYLESKFKIFSNQKKSDLAFLEKKKYFNIFRSKKYESRLKKVELKKFLNIKNKIQNKYFESKINDNNASFVYEISKIFKIKDNEFIKYIKTFKGLEHRHEVFYKKKNYQFINDSKATSFASTKKALLSNKNIYWILGGLPKVKDKIALSNIKKNIKKAYIIGKNISFFKNQLKGKVKYTISNNLKKAIIQIFKDIGDKNYQLSVLFSPSSASYDQYKNFVERGNEFKKLVRYYVKKKLK